jgi:hypothetical protein
MKSSILLLVMVLGTGFAHAQTEWPIVIKSDLGQIRVFQPQPLSFQDNKVESISAVSITGKGKSEPMFGSVWSEAVMSTDRDSRMLHLEKLTVLEVRLPGISDTDQIAHFKNILETEAIRLDVLISMDDLLATLDMNGMNGVADDLGTDPPVIHYRDKASILVMIDGDPKMVEEKELGVSRVVNTPFTIVRTGSGPYYLYGGGYWYSARRLEGPWSVTTALPAEISAVDRAIREAEKDEEVVKSPTPSDVIVSFEPAELIQSDGEAQFAPLQGTGLLYMSNTDEMILMDINSQQYYVLLSGRWYRAARLSGPWTYAPADRLPDDFANIPEGSAMETALVSVAGTPQAREAVLDAQVPQTAKVERSTASASVQYDGQPRFDPIEGTDLAYAVNTASSVIKYGNNYYVVEDGVWFVGPGPQGPWEVATSRPESVSRIPPTVPVYNVKYVYIYDVTPEYIYMGYTPGYLGTYVMGPTVVYGTGFYYSPWYVTYFVPRPVTWGFSMHYNPWTGWSMGVGYSFGWFHMSVWRGSPMFWGGGWWGPPVFRPPFHCWRHPGWGRTNVFINVNVNRNNTVNVYRNRRDVVSRDLPRRPEPSTRPSRPAGDRTPSSRPSTGTGTTTRPSGRPSTGTTTRPSDRPSTGTTTRPSDRPSTGTSTRPSTRPGTGSNVVADRDGTVYQRSREGTWQQNTGSGWRTTQPSSGSYVQRQQQMRDQGSSNSFNRTQTTNRGGGVGTGYQSRPSPSSTGSRTAPASRPSGGTRTPTRRP